MSQLILPGTAGLGDVLSGKTFSAGTNYGATGTMPNNGAVVITPGTSNQTIAAGYHNGSGYVKGDTNLTAANIKSGVSIFGVSGSLVPGTPYATGTATSASSTTFFTTDAGSTKAEYALTISGLSFTPSRIVAVHFDATSGSDATVVDTTDQLAYNSNSHILNSGTYFQVTNPAVIGTTCIIPVSIGNKPYTWYAYQ